MVGAIHRTQIVSPFCFRGSWRWKQICKSFPAEKQFHPILSQRSRQARVGSHSMGLGRGTVPAFRLFLTIFSRFQHEPKPQDFRG